MEAPPGWFLAQISPTFGDISTFCTSPEIRKVYYYDCFQKAMPRKLIQDALTHSVLQPGA